MESSNITKTVSQKIWSSRIRILSKSPFFAGILYDLQFYFSKEEKLLSCDGKNIYINPETFSKLSDKEVDICILHELMHIVLKHPFRYDKRFNSSLFRLACDMVVNSNIINLFDPEKQNELIVDGRKLPHLTPNKEEAYLYSVEEVYEMLKKSYPHLANKKDDDEEEDDDEDSDATSNETDSMLIKDTAKKTKKYGEVLADRSTKLHLRLVEDDVDLESFEHTYQMMSQVQNDGYEVKVNMFIDIPVYPYYYDPTLSDSDTYYPFMEKLTPTLLADLKKNAIPLKDIKYQKKVYAKELGITKDQYAYFDKLEQSLHFKGDKEIIFKIRNYIASSAVYNVNSKPCPSGYDDVLYFLDVSREGKCVEFANAAIAMYRYYDIPARFVSGFYIKSKKDKVTDIYDSDAHAWVEVYVDNVGWLMMDPTPVVAKVVEKGDGDKSKFDSHSRWQGKHGNSGDYSEEDDINDKIMKGVEIAKMLNDKHVPKAARELAFAAKNPELDWRELLNDFLQENINDYSFAPGDKRFSDSEFILPDFNDKDFDPEKVIFMVDMSGSMSNKAVMDCLSEIKGAIDLYNGKLIGYVGLFDTEVEKYGPIEEFEEGFLNDIKGTGGTSFHCIYDFLNKKIEPSDDITKLIILTDGDCTYPKEEDTKRFDTVWIINNKYITPPWGKVIRMINNKKGE